MPPSPLNPQLSAAFPSRLTTLCDGRPGLRGGMHVEVLTPSGTQPSTKDPQPVLDFISSDETLDRYGEIISASGWKLDNYLRNPVFQNSHQYGDILFTLGKALITEVREVGRVVPSAPPRMALFQRIQFAVDANPMARIAYSLYKDGFLNTVSVGFIPLRWEDGSPSSSSSSSSSPLSSSSSPSSSSSFARPERLVAPECSEGGSDAGSPSSSSSRNPLSPSDGERVGVRGQLSTLNSQPSTNCRRKFLEQELLEVSAVAIPANPNALALGLKSGAVEKADLRDLAALLRLTLDPPNRSADFQSAVSPISNRQPPAHPPRPIAARVSQPSTINYQPLLPLARQLRDIMKHL